jgi:hypothetical protein
LTAAFRDGDLDGIASQHTEYDIPLPQGRLAAMFSNLLAVLRRVVALGVSKELVLAFGLFAVVSLVMLCLPAWRRREQAAWRGEGRFGLATLFAAAAFRLSVVMAVVGSLAAALMAQKGLFSEKHGCVTQRNYEAVQTKWGVSHEQSDLAVHHYIMHKKVEEELADDSTRERWLDERQPALTDEERIPISDETFAAPPRKQDEPVDLHRVARRTVAWVREQVAQDSITTCEAVIGIRSSPRRLGNATYAGYEDSWYLKYGIRNTAGFETAAVLRFPLPAEGSGLFDRLSVKVNGQDWLSNVRYRNGALEWRMLMPAGKEWAVEIGYQSRGLEYFRYKPGNMRSRCLVTVNVDGIDARRLNFPIGSMPPRDDLKSLSGSKYALHWDLSYAVSNLDIGLIIPSEEQPGYYITNLLGAAPVAVALLALMLFVTRRLTSGKLQLLPVCLVLGAFYAGNALLANLNDMVTEFPAAFAIAVLPIVAAVWLFWRKIDGRGFTSAQSAALYAVFAVFYPMASLSGEGGTLVYVLYTVLLLYVLGLVAWNLTRKTAAAEEAA